MSFLNDIWAVTIIGGVVAGIFVGGIFYILKIRSLPDKEVDNKWLDSNSWIGELKKKYDLRWSDKNKIAHRLRDGYAIVFFKPNFWQRQQLINDSGQVLLKKRKA